MKKRPSIGGFLGRTILAIVLAGAGTGAWASVRPASPSVPSARQEISANCNAIGQQMAASEGGQLRKAVAQQQGGRTVCVITYTVPSRGGQPPRRVERVVNAG